MTACATGPLNRSDAELSHPAGLYSRTMQGVARSLGAGTMSLYNHVKSKCDLLGAVSEHLWAEIAGLAPASDDPARSLAPTSAQLARHKHGDPCWWSVRVKRLVTCGDAS